MTETTNPSSTLAGIRERWEARKRSSLGFDPVDAIALLAALDAVLALHHPKPVYGLAFAAEGGKPLCAHDPDTDPDAHFEGDDGYWYCRDKITAQACAQCADEDVADLWAEWPCPTFEAIASALTGEGT